MLKRTGAFLVLLGLVVVTPVAVAAPAAAAVPEGLEYVALGDSYSAGFGILPLVPATGPGSQNPGCFQAEQNYPHQVAAALGLDLTDVTCSGAVTANITTTPQAPMYQPPGVTVPIQGAALSASTDIVTVTIGGNDFLFADTAMSCLAQGPSGPLLPGAPANCRDIYHLGNLPGEDILVDRLEDVVAPNLAAAFSYIRTQAPNAKVFVIGYPTIAPAEAQVPTGGCYSSPLGTGGNPFQPPFPQNAFPFTNVDTLYLHGIENRLDDTIQTAAQNAGFTFISTWDQTATKSACSSDPYIFGITLTQDAADGQPIPGFDDLYVKLGALHPNSTGVSFFAQQVISAIQNHPAFADPAPAPVLPATGPGVAQPSLWVGLAIGFAGAVLITIGAIRRSRVRG